MRYVFGPFELDSEARLLRHEGEPLPLGGKILDTLLVLVRNRGRLVEKDELLSVVWAGSAVEEANLSQSIFTLRKMLGDTPKDRRYIATIAGRGYQFVAPVLELEAAAPPSEKRRSTAHARYPLAGAAALIGLFVTAILLWQARPASPHPVLPGHLRRFTSLPGVETMPAFSPDGRQIAYVHSDRDPSELLPVFRQKSHVNVYTKLIDAGTELRVTNHLGADYYPAWSPNGEYIAFYRDEAEASGFYIVSAFGGEERRLTDERAESTGITWSPDGQQLLVSQMSAGSQAAPIYQLSVATGERRPLTSPPADTLGDAWPVVSPDGKTLAFARVTGTGSFHLCLWQLGKQTSPLCAPTAGHMPSGLAWTARGDALIVSSLINAAFGVWRYDLKSGASSMLSSEEEEADRPATSRQGAVAYVVYAINAPLWQLDLGSAHAPKPSETKPIASSSGWQLDPDFSPDTTKLAFMSQRGGTPEIWLTEIQTQTSRQLSHMGRAGVGSPSWSPDGRRIAFDAVDGASAQIHVISSQGGKAEQLTAGAVENIVPSWSRDGRFIYFSSNRSGDFQIWKCPAGQPESAATPARQVTRHGGLRAFESADGRYLYYAKGRGKSGLWRKNLLSADGAEECVLASLQDFGWWALGIDHIFFFERLSSIDPQVRLKALILATGEIKELARLPFDVPDATPALAISRNGRFLAYPQVQTREGDIMLADHMQ